MNSKLLIVDDDEGVRTQLKWALNGDYDVFLAEDRAKALLLVKEHRPPVVLLDLGLPPHPDLPDEGLATLAEILALNNLTKVIIVSGQDRKANALNAIAAGAHDFLAKPVDLNELKIILQRTFQFASLESEYQAIRQRARYETFEGMLGNSAPMQAVFSTIRKVATTSAPVLILGESGTGKERVASAIHRLGARSHGQFVAINCSAIPENLLESELFGHEKGAFSGAQMLKKGRIESANGGTLYLDEIGELPASIQVKLLRFLQNQRVLRVGGREEIEIDARVLAGTNVDLKQAISQGRFREDLYYRLAVITLRLPPLRDRENDLLFLANDFLRRFGAETRRPGLTFDPNARLAITQHDWPGNVRELLNRIKRAVIMADGSRITPEDLELPGTGASTQTTNLKEARETLERELIQKALRRHSGKVALAAADLCISRPTLYELMEKLGIQRAEREPRLDAERAR